MKRLVSLIALFVMLLPSVALATVQEENCDFDSETQFKYEVTEDVWEPSDPGIDLIVMSEKIEDDETEVTEFGAPEGWRVVCQKAPHENAGVSHVVIERVTTTTTQPTTTTTVAETTTTVEETTTTTESSTTTSEPEDTTTTVVEEETSTTANDETTSTENRDTETPDKEEGEVLPFTGVNGYWFLGALALSLAGLAALGYASRFVKE